MKRFCKLSGIIAAAVFMAGSVFPLYSAASPASDLVTQINAVSGLSAAMSGNVLTVAGAAYLNTNLTLNIDTGVTVNWDAALTGNAALNHYLLTLSGSGTFTLMDGGSISATSGAGGTLYLSGGVTLNVAAGEISSPGSGSAVTIAAGTQNAKINVSGGAIRSVPNGYAINDGAGMTASDNNTAIRVSAGLVEAGSACAIRSTGIASVVTVLGGEVRNAAGSNTNSVIYMNYAPAPDNGLDNIVVSGGMVRTTNAGNQSYVLQSSQNVRISGGEVQALAGRAVNLVGDHSVATVTGGRVSTVSGTAISTATTTLDDVNDAKVVISGGTVEATGTGTAVKITGYNSTAEIAGGAQVLAKSGLAVDASGRPAADAVRVDGGFVFAWGSAMTGGGNVIAPANKLNAAVGGVVAAWDTAAGIGTAPYGQGERDDLSMLPANSVYWDKNPDSSALFDGIRFDNGSASGFFELNVTVIQLYFTLTVNDGSGTPIVSVHKAGEAVAVSAAPGETINTSLNPTLNPVNGTVFLKWTTNNGGSFEEDVQAETTFIMPSDNVTITALYTPRYLLHVIGGSIDAGDRNFGGSASYGYYAQGEAIGITGNSSFVEWVTASGGTFADGTSQSTAFVMPGNEAMVQGITGTYTRPALPEYTTEIANDSGIMTGTTGGAPVSPPYTAYTGAAGTGITVRARNAAPGEVFSRWEIVGGARGFFADAYAPETTFIMLENGTIEAKFDKLYTLIVDGEIQGEYKAGAMVPVSAVSAPVGKRFGGWTTTGDGVFDDADLLSAVFTMPAADAEISATYADIPYTLTVINGSDQSGGPLHIYGETVHIKTDAPEDGMEFDGWVIVSGSGTLGDPLSSGTTFVMPAENVILIATYAAVSELGPVPDTGGDNRVTAGWIAGLSLLGSAVLFAARRKRNPIG